MSQSITTLTFFRFEKPKDRLWAFWMMQFAHKHLSKINGCTFYKLMGSGKGRGFDPRPDWGVYSLLQVWDNESSAELFKRSEIYTRYLNHSSSFWQLKMIPITAKGTWSGKNPFLISDNSLSVYPIAVITRATIKWSKLIRFWRYVPHSQSGLFENKGLIFTKGIGEVPVRQMATFSLWNNSEALKEFAYQGQAHKKAIQLTRQLDWYSEEMFVRFAVVQQEGVPFYSVK